MPLKRVHMLRNSHNFELTKHFDKIYCRVTSTYTVLFNTGYS